MLKRRLKHQSFKLSLVALVYLLASAWAQAQGSAFTYQGRLTDAGNPADGLYDIQFKLFDTPDVDTGAQQGATLTHPTVQVSKGIFTAQLDFGPAVFNGLARYIEISIRPTGNPNPHIVLGPRQAVTATPYSVRSLSAAVADNATQLGGQSASGFIQNTTTQQGATDFNIGGTGTAGTLNAGTQFNLGGSRILSIAGTNNLFTGIDAGAVNSTGTGNSFFGRSAGLSNLGGSSNSFYGSFAGQNNQAGSSNSFFGFVAGLNNAASSNSFFGRGAGFTNSSGTRNAFFGTNASDLNTTGSDNSSFGFNAGKSNTTGGSSVFIGSAAGITNTTGGNITIVGAGSDVTSNGLNFATAIGSGAVVGTSDTVVLGKAAGTYNGIARPADTIQIPGTLNISGSLGAGILSAATQFNLGGNRVLSNPGTGNFFVGIGAGTANSGSFNSFFGNSAGRDNTSGVENSFFGRTAGLKNLSGSQNSFFGFNAGQANTLGSANSFFGTSAGFANTDGILNSFFGYQAGTGNTDGDQNTFFGAYTGVTSTGSFNSFIGEAAGNNNTLGSNNSFLGWLAGSNNTTGGNNTFIGSVAIFNTTNTTGGGNTALGADSRITSGLFNATAIGFRAQATQNNSLVLGGISGVNSGTDTNIGIGTSTPAARLHIKANTGNLLLGDSGCGTQFNGFGFGSSLTCNNYSMLGEGTSTWINRATGGYIFFREGNNDQLVINPGGVVSLYYAGTGGNPQFTLCLNPSSQIATCSSSRRYKTNIEPYKDGLNLINQLNPVSFNWKTTDQADIGLIAEDVMEAEPRLAYRNQKGEIEGVSYSQMSVVLINAVKEQQAQIAEQKEEIKQQQAQIDSLKKIVCLDHPDAEICKPDK